MSLSLLIDVTRCVGCNACALACKEINGLPKETIDGKLSATTWTTVQSRSGVQVRRQCMHCLEPACVSVCPVGALQRNDNGAVTYDETRCIGCRYCMVGCPFGIPRYEWDSALPRVRKCILCFDKRLREGRPPACAEACPTGATTFGQRDALIEEARRRLRENPERYVDHIYGLEEAGGTAVLYLSSVPFAELGLPTSVQHDPYPRLTWNILSKLPNVVTIGGVAMFGIWWIIHRRQAMDEIRMMEVPAEGDTPSRSIAGGGVES